MSEQRAALLCSAYGGKRFESPQLHPMAKAADPGIPVRRPLSLPSPSRLWDPARSGQVLRGGCISRRLAAAAETLSISSLSEFLALHRSSLRARSWSTDG